MHIVDYFNEKSGNHLYKDDAGNFYLEKTDLYNTYLTYLEDLMQSEEDMDYFFLSKEDYEKFGRVDLAVNDVKSVSDVRKPYFRIRGKSVTQEQAFEIIRRTDFLFVFLSSVCGHPDYIGGYHCISRILLDSQYEKGKGWCHPDGTIGVNGICGKYPEVEEFIAEWFSYLTEFPFLDVIMAVTDWDEVPYEVYEKDYECRYSWESEETYDRLFLKSIQFAVHVHDNKIEVLEHVEAVKRYSEYDEKYKNYGDHSSKIDKEFLDRCFSAYGLDAKKELPTIINKPMRNFWYRVYGMEVDD